MRGYVEAQEARAKYGEGALNDVERALVVKPIVPSGDTDTEED